MYRTMVFFSFRVRATVATSQMVGKWGLVSNDFSPNPALSFYILKAVRCADCGGFLYSKGTV